MINTNQALMTKEQAEKLCCYQQQQISKWRRALKNREAFEAEIVEGAKRKALRRVDQKGASGTGENEWHTPAEWLALARKVLGKIDLDPASTDVAQKTVKAARFFTKEENGLEQEWEGCVWLNPPYAQPAIAQFADKAVEEFQAGRAIAIIVLTHNYTDTAWFHTLAHAASAIAFPRGRIGFISPTGEVAAPTQGQAFSLLSNDADMQQRFVELFSEKGFVVRSC